jgi:DNA mismatch repair protein MutS
VNNLISQYLSIQTEYESKYGSDTIVFMEVGSFFEIYQVGKIGKAKEISNILNIVLTKKNKSNPDITEANPYLAGVPTISLDKHINRIADQNKYTIIIVEQTTPPPQVTREVTRIISPGTNTNTNTTQNNFYINIVLEKVKKDFYLFSTTVIDVSTGEIYLEESHSTDDYKNKPIDSIRGIFIKYNPVEAQICLVDFDSADKLIIEKSIPTGCITRIIKYKYANVNQINSALEATFNLKQNITPIESFGLEKNQPSYNSLAVALKFIKDHNPLILKSLKPPIIISEDNGLSLFNDALMQLNIVDNSNSANKTGSVFDLLNNCATPMGSRLLKNRITNPINNNEMLASRYYEIQDIIKNQSQDEIKNILKQITDIDRAFSSIIRSTNQLYHYDKIKEIVIFTDNLITTTNSDSPMVKNNCKDVVDFIVNSFGDNISSIAIDLHIIKTPRNKNSISLHQEQNKLNEITNEINRYIKSFSLGNNVEISLGNNDKLGHFIEITNTQLKSFSNPKNHKVHRLSAKNRIFTTELSELSEKYNYLNLSVKDKMDKYIEFVTNDFIDLAKLKIPTISSFIAKIDVACNSAFLISEYNYSIPEILNNDSTSLSLTTLRHPIVERISPTKYVDNDISLSSSKITGNILFGVNATGKSTILKATGVCIILAQSGIPVPCKMKFTLLSRLFTRITTRDNILSNQSTFTQEMTELKIISDNIDDKSIVLADELSHGTETTSGVSILASTIDFLEKKGALFIFTTHLHQINKIKFIKNNPSIESKHLSVELKNNKIVYKRKLLSGSGDPTYGIIVAKGIGVHKDIISKAIRVMNSISPDDEIIPEFSSDKNKYNVNKPTSPCEICGCKSTETHHIAPQKIFTKQSKLKNLTSNLMNVCESCHTAIHNKTISPIIVQTSEGVDIISSISLDEK